MKKTILKDDNGKSLEVDLEEFIEHLNLFFNTLSENMIYVILVFRLFTF